MGNSIRSFLQKAGCTDRVLNYLFSTHFEQLISAIQKCDMEKVKFFHLIKKVSFSEYIYKVKQGDSPLLTPGDSPLHIAVSFEHLEIVKYIVENVKPLNLEDKNFNGDTPFMLAAIRGNLSIIIYLAEVARCNVNARENKGATPFFAACCNGNVEAIDYFIHNLKVDSKVVNFEGQSVVHRVAFYGLIDVLRFLRKNTNLSFSAIDKKGNSPLHLAALRLNFTCIRYLLRHSSKKDTLLAQKNLDSETPVSILLRILNKVKDPSISEITKEEVIKYIEDKKEFPPIQKNEITSKIRPTLIGNSAKKDKTMLGENHLKIPINPFQLNPNILPRTLKVNNRRDLILSKVTPLNTEKRPAFPIITSKRNITGSKRELPQENPSSKENNRETIKENKEIPPAIEPEEQKETFDEIKSALVQKRNPNRGRKNTPSPMKNQEKEKTLEKGSPGKLGGSPLNKIKQAIFNKFSFLTSPKKRKLANNINTSKPIKGLSFKEMSEKVTREEGGLLLEENHNLNSIREEFNRGQLEGNYEDEILNQRNQFSGVNSLFKNAFQKSPLNKLHFNYDLENGGTPVNATYRMEEIPVQMKIKVDDPNSMFYVIAMENGWVSPKNEVSSESEIKMKKNAKA